MKKQVHDVKNSFTFDFATSAFEANSFECILFQGKATFDCVVKNIRALWEPIINDYVKCTKEIALESIHLLRQDKRTKMYDSLISVIHAECEYMLWNVWCNLPFLFTLHPLALTMSVSRLIFLAYRSRVFTEIRLAQVSRRLYGVPTRRRFLWHDKSLF